MSTYEPTARGLDTKLTAHVWVFDSLFNQVKNNDDPLTKVLKPGINPALNNAVSQDWH